MFLLILIILFFVFLAVKIILEILFEKTPFIPVPYKTLERILKEIEIKENEIVYDLGSGDGRFLFKAYFQNPKAIYIGLEKNFFPYFLSKIKLFFLKFKFKEINKKIKIYRQNFFKTNLSQADIIYFYLSSSLIKKLEPKLLKEIQEKTKIISCDFPLTNFDLIKIIKIPNKNGIGKNIFIYQKAN